MIELIKSVYFPDKKLSFFANFLFYFINILFFIFVFIMWTYSAFFPMNLVLIGISILLILCIFLFCLLTDGIHLDLFFLFLSLFLIFVLISTIFNLRKAPFFKTPFLLMPLCYVFYLFTSQNKRNLKSFVIIFIVACTFFSFAYIFKYKSELFTFSSFERLGDDFDNQNSIARCFVILGLLTLYLSKRKGFKLLSFYYPICLFLCLSTGSISNTLCLLILGATTLFIEISRKKKLILSIIISVSFCILILILQLPFAAYFKTRIDNIFFTFFGSGSGRIDQSSFLRFEGAVDGLQLFLTKPLFGNGHGIVEYISPGAGSFSHNNISDLLSNFGLLATISYEVILFYPIIKKNYKNCFIIVNAYLIIFQFFLVTYYLKPDIILLAFFYSQLDLSRYRFLTIKKQNCKIIVKFVNPIKLIKNVLNEKKFERVEI